MDVGRSNPTYRQADALLAELPGSEYEALAYGYDLTGDEQSAWLLCAMGRRPLSPGADGRLRLDNAYAREDLLVAAC